MKAIPQYCIAHPYCARFFASLARANERVHIQPVHNVRDFPQAKLDSEIYARLLLTSMVFYCISLENKLSS